MKRITPAVILFLGCILTANYATTHWGMVPIGLGLVSAGTFAAGLALLARDVVQDVAGRRAVVVLIVIGATLSWFLSDGRIALASGIAFLVSELVDMAIFTPLRKSSWAGAVTTSNAGGAIIDSILFLSIAGFGLTWGSVTGQWLIKMVVTVATVGFVVAVRARRVVTA